MRINLIIGAGQLGSRHLQGLLRLQLEQQIYVLDPSEDSLKIAKERAKEIPNNNIIKYETGWEHLPNKFDLVIIATGANVRAKVVKKLLESYKVNYLVLEKILFQDLESYENIELLLNQTKTTTWVNLPRRMNKQYQVIKKIVSNSNENITFHNVGGNWGLACNAIHMIDLCAFLTASEVVKIDMDWVDPVIYPSKRVDNIEFTGSVKGYLKDNSRFLISSLDGECSEDTIYISTISHRWIIQEGTAKKIIYLSKENDFKASISDFRMDYQSDLTTKIANDIFELGSCDLPTYKDACNSHIPFIEAFLRKYIEISGIETNSCPIT